MKKVKQILAILAIILLVALYMTTIVMAIIDHSQSMNMFKASIGLTILIPILIWLYTFFYKTISNHKKANRPEPEETATSDRQ